MTANFEVVAALLEGDTEDLLVFHLGGNIVRINGNHIIAALALGLQNSQGLLSIAGSDNTIRNLRRDQLGGQFVADIRQSYPVAKGAETVCTTGADIGTGQRVLIQAFHIFYKASLLQLQRQGLAYSGTGGRNMLKGSGTSHAGSFLQFLDQLPGVQGIHKVDIAGTAIQNGDGQFAAIMHIQLSRLLIGVAAILQFKFLHCFSPLYMLVQNPLLYLAGLQIGIANKQGNLIIGVQVLPQHSGESFHIIVHSHPLRLALESGDHGISVADISMEEMAQSGNGGIFPEESGAGAAFSIGSLQDGHLVAAVAGQQTGNTGCPVGAVIFKHAGTQGSFPAFASGQILPNGICLVAVGNDQAAACFANGMIDDQVGILHQAGIVGLGTDAVRLKLEYTVAGIHAAAHDEIGSNRLLAIRGNAQNDTAAGIGVGGKLFFQTADFIDIHITRSPL